MLEMYIILGTNERPEVELRGNVEGDIIEYVVIN